jgi:hypothetical protein
MSAVREERHLKLNLDKKMKLKRKTIKTMHKSKSHLSEREMYFIDKELSKDYFPAE